MQDCDLDFFNLSANELLALNLILTLVFCNGLNENQMNILGNFISALGENILLVQAKISTNPHQNFIYYINNGCAEPPVENNLPKEIADLKNRLKTLETLLAAKET